jgi:hypothetical protein
MKRNYVLVDFENVRLETVEELDSEVFRLMVFVGATQNKLNYELVAAMQRMGERAEYVKIAGEGRNNLDFHIACYAGRLTALDPECYVHIISKDKDYDRMVEHLQTKGFHVARWNSVADIPILKMTSTAPLDDKQSTILAYLLKRGEQRPASIKTLSGSVSALFQPKLEEAEVTALLDQLQALGLYTLNGNKVVYSLPA